MKQPPRDLDALLADSDKVTAALRGAVLKVLAQHKALGQSIVVWQDGKVVVLRPEEIPLALPEDAEWQDAPIQRES